MLSLNLAFLNELVVYRHFFDDVFNGAFEVFPFAVIGRVDVVDALLEKKLVYLRHILESRVVDGNGLTALRFNHLHAGNV